ncbi:MAG: ABC transporter ATP-binding protein [Chitinophagales bacterium]|nr:ABC transporter ATP-binding protein [Chitinophagales bacterium]
MSKLLHIDHLCIGYSKTLVSNVQAVFEPNEISIVLGVNGSGKTTLLKTIAGLMSPLSGDIFYKGNSINVLTRKDLSTMISFTLNSNVSANITVQEFLSFSNINQAYNQDNLNEIFDQFQVAPFLHKHLHSISDGQRQMVSIARCIVQNTPIVYLDEPTAFLDYKNVRNVMSMVQFYATSGKSFIINTHDRVWIEELERKKIYGISQCCFKNLTDRPNWDSLKNEFA